MSNHSIIQSISLGVCILVFGVSRGAEIEYEVRAGVSESDNIGRTESATIDETIILAGLKLDFLQESQRLDVSLVTDVEHRNYQDNTFENETVGALNADIDLKLIRDTFSWVVENRYGNLQSNPFLAETPDNREDVNVFSTGPDFRTRLGPKNSLELGGRYSSSYFETSDIDGDVTSGQASLIRSVSSNRELSISYGEDRYEFDNVIENDDYDVAAIYFGIESESARGNLTFNAGISELTLGSSEFDEVLINFLFVRSLTASTTLNIQYNQGFSSVSDSFNRFQEPGRDFAAAQRTAGVGVPFRLQNAQVGVDFNRRGNAYYLSARFSGEEYLDTIFLDTDRLDFSLGFVRVLGSNWQFLVDASWGSTSFASTVRDDEDQAYRIGLSRQFGRYLNVGVDFGRFDRDSNTPNASYVENVASLVFRYGQ